MHESAVLVLYNELLKLAEDHSVFLEEYARTQVPTDLDILMHTHRLFCA